MKPNRPWYLWLGLLCLAVIGAACGGRQNALPPAMAETALVQTTLMTAEPGPLTMTAILAQASPSPTVTPPFEASANPFVSLVETPTSTSTPSPTPTPWPTPTPFPAALAATPVLSNLAPLGVAWIQPAGYWAGRLGGSQLPRAWQYEELLIVDNPGFGGVQALSTASGALAWRYPVDLVSELGERIYIDGLAVAGDVVAIDASQELLALDASTGQTRWRIASLERSPLIASAGASLYLWDFRDYPPQIVALDAATGQEHWRHDCLGSSNDPVWATSDWLFVACEDDVGLASIVQLSASDGVPLLLRPVPSQATLVGYQQGVLFLGMPARPSMPYFADQGNDAQITALDWVTGQLLWQAYLADLTSIQVNDDGVVMSAGNQLQRRILREGESLWITTLPVDDRGLRVNQAVRDGSRLLVGSDSGFLYALDWQTGDLLWMQDLWSELDLPWRPVTPLAVAGDAVLVWMSLTNGDAVVSLQRGPSLAAWPTPTFLPNAVFVPPTPTPGPVSTSTPPPPSWTPEPVRWIPSHWMEFPEAEQAMEDQLLTWLNLHPGDYDGFAEQMRQWPAIDDPEAEAPASYPEDYVSWVEQADLDGDGQAEDIVAYGLRLKSWAVLKTDNRGIRVLHKQPGKFYDGSLQFVLADDINCDGKIELVIQTLGWTTQNVYLDARIGQLLRSGQDQGEDDPVWRDLGEVWSSGRDADQLSIRFEDTDDDGCLEGITRIHPVKLVFDRPQTWTFRFQGGRYQLTATRGDPDELSLFKVLDARGALAEGDLDRSLMLALQALENPNSDRRLSFGSFDGSWAEARIASYAAALAMLIHGQRNEPEAMQELLAQVEASYDRSDNPYLPAARALWKTYATTGDVLQACQAMERVIRLRGDPQLLPYASERLEIEEVCPLD